MSNSHFPMTFSQFSDGLLELPKSERPILQSSLKALQAKFPKETTIYAFAHANPSLTSEGFMVFLEESFVILKIKSGLFAKATIQEIIPYSLISSVDFDIASPLLNPAKVRLGSLEIQYKKTFGSSKLKLRNIDEAKVQEYCTVLKSLALSSKKK